MTLDERPHITDLLPSHQALLEAHHGRLVALMAIAIRQGVPPSTMAFIVAEGLFAESCLHEGCGHEFEIPTAEITTVVVPLGCDDGLVPILAAMIPEGVMPVASRPLGTTAVLVVDADDEPAVVLKDIEELMPVPAS